RDCDLNFLGKEEAQHGLTGSNLTFVNTNWIGTQSTDTLMTVDNLTWVNGRISGNTSKGDRLMELVNGPVRLGDRLIDGNTVDKTTPGALIATNFGASIVNSTIVNNQLINVASPNLATAGVRAYTQLKLDNTIL